MSAWGRVTASDKREACTWAELGPHAQGEIVRLEQQAVDLTDENTALRSESERLEARDNALQGYG